MRAIAIQPISIDPTAITTGEAAYRALASAAGSYLARLDSLVAEHGAPDRCAMVTRVRGTGPGVSFGHLIDTLEQNISRTWECPFEGSQNVSGASMLAADVLGEARTDGFLFLRFAPHTRDLPLHIHPASDRFIYVIGGRGFFHLSPGGLYDCVIDRIRHVPARDRDAFMFRRGVVHTFSTAEHPLLLLSYHRPFIALDDDSQYTVGSHPLIPEEFLRGHRSAVSFDAAWNCLT